VLHIPPRARGPLHDIYHMGDRQDGHPALQIAGMLIAPVAFVFILYALFMYKKRTIQVPFCAAAPKQRQKSNA
jgi:hypothetical protein